MNQMSLSWTDVHTHLNMLEMPPEEALRLAAEQNVQKMITIGTCPEDLPIVLELARKFAPRVRCSLGVHPHEASLYTTEIGQWILQHATAPEVVAIGETGLDYYRNETPREVQIDAFRAQLTLAQQLRLPVEIHTRDAEADTMKILEDFSGPDRGLLHCFTGSMELALCGLRCGYDISISGVITFKNAATLRQVLRAVPLDRLHVETDAPYLAPVPHRGKKNHPAWVVHTAQTIADELGFSLEHVQEATQQNAQRLFPKL